MICRLAQRVTLYFLFLFLFSGCAPAQDIVVLHHTNYTTHFSKSKHIPVLVEYTLSASMLACDEHIHRKGEKFKPDPELPDETNLQRDYTHSGYDRGHNMSAQDNECSQTGMDECFYFSNMFPQLHAFNAGTWEELEKKEREEATQFGEIKVFIGNIGTLSTIGEDHVVVPAYCWKIIYIPSQTNYHCYIFPNDTPTDNDIEHYTISLDSLEMKTGISIKGTTATVPDEAK